MSIPHEYVAAILVEFNNGTLTWEWLWTNVAKPTIADAAKAAAYELFLDFLQVSWMNRAGANAGDPDRDPVTEMDHGAGIVTPSIQDKALQVAEDFLPGLHPPVGVTAQLNQVQLQQTRLATQIAECQRHRAKTLQRDKPTSMRQSYAFVRWQQRLLQHRIGVCTHLLTLRAGSPRWNKQHAR